MSLEWALSAKIGMRRTIGIHFVDHVLELSFRGVLAQGPHDSAQLLGGDGAVTILVKEGEGFLELGNLLFCQLVGLYGKAFKSKRET